MTNCQDSARAVIEQIWYRARINAFAHREASEEALRSSRRYFQGEIIATLLSILCVIMIYVFSAEAVPSDTWNWAGDIWIFWAFI